jgi:ribosomal protein S18 acetylase RimI-like enzyme
MSRNVLIRRLEAEDLGFAYRMVSKEQWNDRKADLARMLEYEPNGCFIAEVGRARAGHVFSVSYGQLGWIGLLIVDVKHRKKGIATMLMETAVDYLLGQGVETIKLEAVAEVADLYRRLGFVDEYDSLRYVGISQRRATLENHCKNIRWPTELPEIAKFDAEYFGADRSKVLNKLCKEFPRLCFVSRGNSHVTGYIMCRKALVGYKLGPWVCKPENRLEATMLLTACLSKMKEGEKIYVGVPGLNTSAVNVLQQFGFTQYYKSIRMRYGKKLDDRVDGVFAIGGAMKG